jgi:hypothetical protein
MRTKRLSWLALGRVRVRSADTFVSGHATPDAVADQRGAVFVEFLIAFLPVYVFFLCLLQLTILFSSRLITEHAAVHAARAAAVVAGDDPSRYGGEDLHRLTPGGEREGAIRKAVILTLAPLILTGLAQDVEVLFPEAEMTFGPGQVGDVAYEPMCESSVAKVRVRVEVDVMCRIGFANKIACPFGGQGGLFGVRTKRVRAEAVYPYQWARYVY